MSHARTKHTRILGIAPSSRGFGFAVLEGQETLADWGTKYVKGDKNSQSLANVKELIALYQPNVIALEDTSAKNSRRAPRIRALTKRIIALASSRNVKVALFSHKRIRAAFFTNGPGTKHSLAEILAKRFPEQLSFRVPPRRRPWMSEDSRMNVFDAVALTQILQVLSKLRKQEEGEGTQLPSRGSALNR
jgi:Holliday junction resolvasome RuvABC endonuclease subunit